MQPSYKSDIEKESSNKILTFYYQLFIFKELIKDVLYNLEHFLFIAFS